MENGTLYLGFDISTTCIGTCIYLDDDSDNGKVLKLGSFPLKDTSIPKGEELYIKKKRFMEQVVLPYRDMYGSFDRIVIEEPLLRSNNVNTVGVLMKFNGMISDAVYNTFGKVPQFISSHDARMYSFPSLMAVRKFNKKGEQLDTKSIEKALKKGTLVLFGDYPFDIDKKEVMMNKVNDTFPQLEWQFGKNGELKKENFDANDALIVCMGYRNKERYSGKTPVMDSFSVEKTKEYSEYRYVTKVGNDRFEKIISVVTD